MREWRLDGGDSEKREENKWMLKALRNLNSKDCLSSSIHEELNDLLHLIEVKRNEWFSILHS